MSDGPDLSAELDDAEDIVMGRAETVTTEWGLRYEQGATGVRVLPYGTDERRARREQRLVYRAGKGPAELVRRTVTYGPWEEADA